MSEMLKIESAALRLGGRLLFRDFSLEVRAGEWVCVTGESGCGKTSLLRAALGFLPLEAGRVSVGGEELTEHTVERMRKRTAYVPQELFLPAESVDEMLHLPFHLKANRGGDFSEEKLFRFWTLLGLERDLLHRKVVQLSGGQRGGRTAAHVKRPGAEAVFPHHFPADAQLSQKGLHIGLHQSEAPLHALTDKGAVGAAGGAERNPNIQINIPRRQTLPGLIAHNAGLQR